jgi:hypothetical protein
MAAAAGGGGAQKAILSIVRHDICQGIGCSVDMCADRLECGWQEQDIKLVSL